MEFRSNFKMLRASARNSTFVQNTYGKFRWYTSKRGIAQVIEKINHLGNDVECPFCKWHGKSFYPHPEPHQRPNCLCPQCYSKERHRLLYLYLAQGQFAFYKGLRVLEIGPDRYSSYWGDRIRKGGGQFVTFDLLSSLAMLRADITQIPFNDNSFDLIICYHVLEHVSNDIQAMLEMKRVLTNIGELLVQVPIKGEFTDENLEITDAQGRLKRFGQEDHVRQYGKDFYNRLISTGFDVQLSNFVASLSDDVILRHGLWKNESIVVCTARTY